MEAAAIFPFVVIPTAILSNAPKTTLVENPINRHKKIKTPKDKNMDSFNHIEEGFYYLDQKDHQYSHHQYPKPVKQ